VSNYQAAESVMTPAVAGCGMTIATSAHRFAQAARNRYRAQPVEIWKARNFIAEHSDEELSLTKVAKAANISANHLSERFKQVTGVNFVDYVARTRFEKACELLDNVDLRISEIAFAVGFQSLSQFNRVFKKLCGKSPGAYRAGTKAHKTSQPGHSVPQSRRIIFRKNA
jgi:AraC-like DNA-binding protein